MYINLSKRLVMRTSRSRKSGHRGLNACLQRGQKEIRNLLAKASSMAPQV
jgi:hypothetical protein